MRRPLALLAALLLSAGTALAGPLDDVVRVEFLPGWTTPDGRRMAAFRIELAPGWKTYWRAPGDAGIPPTIRWTGPEGLAAAHLHWPVPEVWHQNGIRSIGYADSVVIPVELVGRAGAAPRRLEGRIEIGVCDDICVPVDVPFAADLPAGAGRDPAIVAALVDQPRPASESGVTEVTCRLTPTDRGLRLSVEIAMPPLGPGETVAIEPGDSPVWVSEPETRREGGRLVAEAELIPAPDAPLTVERSDLRFTVIGGGTAVDIRGCDRG